MALCKGTSRTKSGSIVLAAFDLVALVRKKNRADCRHCKLNLHRIDLIRWRPNGFEFGTYGRR